MTDPRTSRVEASTEVLLVQRARRRRAATYQRRRITVSALALLAVGALAATALAIADDDGGTDPVQSAGGATSTTGAPGTSDPTSTAVGTSTSLLGSTTPTSAPTAPVTTCSTATWPVEQRAALTVFATVRGSEDLETSIERGFGGVFIPTDSISLIDDGTLAEARAGAARAPLASIDEEGGRVQRLRDMIGPLPSARAMHELGPDEIRRLAAVHGRAMVERGLSMDFAPVLDLVEDDDVEGDGGIGDRSFSADPAEAAVDAGAFAAGLAEAGMLPTYKHFPGHGHASGDTHKVLATTPDLEALKTDDLLPYVTLLADGQPVAAVMVGHLDVPGLTEGEPASVSAAAITGLLRNDLGFDGLVVTDDLGGMAGIRDRYTTVEAAVLAVIAGADLALVPFADGPQVVSSLVAAVGDGRLPDAQLTRSADRVLRAQQPLGCPAT